MAGLRRSTNVILRPSPRAPGTLTSALQPSPRMAEAYAQPPAHSQPQPPSQPQPQPPSQPPPQSRSRSQSGPSASGGGAAAAASSGGGGYGGGYYTDGAHLSGAEALAMHGPLLSDFERPEIRSVERVYWDGHTAGKTRAHIPPGENNHGYDDDRGDYTIVVHDHLQWRYEILAIVGKGSFGQVVKAYDHKEGRLVAIKCIRNKARFHKQALVEVKVLTHLRDNDPRDETNSVRMLEHFSFRNHLCIVFELLSFNLYEFMKSNAFMGVSLSLIRRFAVQVLTNLRYLAKHKIVHCDLKPENILLCQPGRSAVKVIDFGSSCFETQPVYSYIQSRFYRSPEVILGLPYYCAIDMWSFGCILAELYSGYPLFPGENETEQLACMMEVLGTPPSSLVAESTRRKQFFDSEGQPRIVANSKGKKRRPASKDLISSLRCTDVSFVTFLEGCLQWDAKQRFTPESALRHEWIGAYVPPAVAERPTRAAGTARGGGSLSARARAAEASTRGAAAIAIGYANEGESNTARAAAREVLALGGAWSDTAPVLPSIGDVSMDLGGGGVSTRYGVPRRH